MAFVAPIAAAAASFAPEIAAVSAVASLAGGVIGAVGAEQSAAAQKQMYDYQAAIASQNQQIQKQNAQYALIQGENQAAIQGQEGRARLGGIIAAQGASGFNVDEGTNVDVQKSQQFITRENETQTRSNAYKAAYDYDIGAVQAGEQAQMDIFAGQNAATAGNINAASSILGSVGSVSSKWLQGTQSGLFAAASPTNPLGATGVEL